ncbi:MAG TPA: type II secretion system F family protein [Candidatus Udaeobacter sp.]|jgi:type II secretory pathway component PulF|nr:type II secretion system F family protein [Candidatus Udaeobacter sp.]
MPQFAYRARDAQGSLVEGVLDCADRAVAIRQIELQKCIPVRIEMVGPEPKTAQRDGAAPQSPTRNLKIPYGQLLVFTEQLAHLLQAGMTLDEGLSVLEKRLKQPRVQQMTHSLHQALVDGRSFSQALSELPRIFPPLYVNLVAAGEASGALPQILLRVVKHLMQAKELRDRVQAALIYPAFLALAGAVLITIFITFMVPQLTGFMAQTGGALPLPTRILMHIHHAITGYWWVGVLAGISAVVGFRALVRSDEGRIGWDRFRLMIPGYGRVIRHRYYAQFSRTLGTLIENGIPLLRALDLVTEIAGNRFLEQKLGDVRKAVIDGATLSAALQSQKLFPDLFTDMMSVGEQTGHFAETMQAIADVYERELDKTVGLISQLIPPVIIVVIAVLVGLVVFSILSAVFEMTHSLQIRPH